MSDYNQRVIDEFRAHGGMVASTGHGRNLVLVHHIGAKSGVERVAPVFARFVERAPGFGAYRERTTRRMPILRLARA